LYTNVNEAMAWSLQRQRQYKLKRQSRTDNEDKTNSLDQVLMQLSRQKNLVATFLTTLYISALIPI